MLRVDSSTGLTALRMQDGLGQRNSSVEDFLSLMASGDIPHQDPHLLNVPFHGHFQLLQQNNSQQQAAAAAAFLVQQQFSSQNQEQSLLQNTNNNYLNFHASPDMDEIGGSTGNAKKRKMANGKS